MKQNNRKKIKHRLLLFAWLTVIIVSCNHKEINNEIRDAVENERIKEFVDGYKKADYDIYNTPAKENGCKYDKVYCVGKIEQEDIEDGDNLSYYLVDNDNQKYWIRIDKKSANNTSNYAELKGAEVCVCGIYTGQIIKDPMPCIVCNKVLKLDSEDVYISSYFGNYSGDFDEDGKIILNEYDDKSNTRIDYFTIQFQLPYNYIEQNLSQENGLYLIHDDALFMVYRIKQDLTNELSDLIKKRKLFDKLEKAEEIKPFLEFDNNLNAQITILNLNKKIDKNKMIYKITRNSRNELFFENLMLYIKNDGIYVMREIYADSFKYNIDGDFNKIVDNIKRWDVSHNPQSFGTHKMVAKSKYENVQENENLQNDFSNIDERINKPHAKSDNSEMITEEIGGVVFKIPKYFDVRKENYDNYYDVAFYPETKKASATLGIKILKSDISSDIVKESKDNIINNWKKLYNNLQLVEKIINGQYVLIGKSKVNGGDVKFAAIANDISRKLVFIIITIDDNDVTSNKYIEDFDIMINNMDFNAGVSNKIGINRNSDLNDGKSMNSNSISESFNDYKNSIDKAKNDINAEIDKSAAELKDSLGLYGKVFDSYIDDYADIYKDAMDKSADIHKNVADDYEKIYKDLLDKYGW